MDYYCISHFQKSINLFCKRPKDGYSKCKTDLKVFFASKDFFQLWDIPTRLIDKHPNRIIKVRLPNSAQNIGKSSGYRVIYLIDFEKQELTFLNIFPKTGKYGLENITVKDLEHLISLFVAEKEHQLLSKINIDNFDI